MALVVALFLLIALLGHWALCVAAFNRAAASRYPCAVVGVLEKAAVAAAAVVPLTFALWLYWCDDIRTINDFASALDGRAWLLYMTVCIVAVMKLGPRWLKLRRRKPIAQLVTNDTEYYDVASEVGHVPVGHWTSRAAMRLPRNEICRLAVPTKTLRLASLPPKLDGLSIVHLSDLHFTGQLTRPYFDFVIDRANELAGDIVVVTGDIVDKQDCLDWIPETLGRLRAKHGIYFVLGNHDKRIADVPALRKLLTQCGLVDVGGRAIAVEINGVEVHLAGNELPWFPLRAAEDVFKPEARATSVFRVLLSHSPDQYLWARDHNYHLMLAGHCHGGQVSLPMIGPIVSPSHHGVKYASGLFFETPTLLHVSRGLSGTHPLRINCVPELAKLVLNHADAT
jgi:predicted MPP superfamily phosphohydrolase